MIKEYNQQCEKSNEWSYFVQVAMAVVKQSVVAIFETASEELTAEVKIVVSVLAMVANTGAVEGDHNNHSNKIEWQMHGGVSTVEFELLIPHCCEDILYR